MHAMPPTSALLAVFQNPELVDHICGLADPEDPYSATLRLFLSMPTHAQYATMMTRHWRNIVVFAGAPPSDIGRVHRQLRRLPKTGTTPTLRLRLNHFGWSSSSHLVAYGLLQPDVVMRLTEVQIYLSQPATDTPWRDHTCHHHPSLTPTDSAQWPMNSSLRILLFDTPELLQVHLHQEESDHWMHSWDERRLEGRFLRAAPLLRELHLGNVMPISACRIESYTDLRSIVSRIPTPSSVLLQLSRHCQHLEYLLLVVADDPEISELAGPIFPSLKTLAAPTNLMMRTIRSASQLPALETIFFEEILSQSLDMNALKPILARTTPLSFGISGHLSKNSDIDLVYSALAASSALGNPVPTITLHKVQLRHLYNIAVNAQFQDLVCRHASRLVVSNCDLTGAIALELMGMAIAVIVPGGQISFEGCSNAVFQGYRGVPTLPDPWRPATETFRDILCEQSIRFHVSA